MFVIFAVTQLYLRLECKVSVTSGVDFEGAELTHYILSIIDMTLVEFGKSQQNKAIKTYF